MDELATPYITDPDEQQHGLGGAPTFVSVQFVAWLLSQPETVRQGSFPESNASESVREEGEEASRRPILTAIDGGRNTLSPGRPPPTRAALRPPRPRE